MKKTTISAGLASLLVLCSTAAHAICHVDANASGSNQGTSWLDAYTSLQTALGNGACSEIWVARGRYKPTSGTDVAASFTIRPGLKVYGGFTGNETTRGQAEPGTNRTVLSGDVDGNDITDADGVVANADPDANKIVGNNSRIVVRMNGTTAAGSIGAETVLNGFTITAGVGSDLENITNTIAGGLYCNGNGSGHACSPTLSRLTFSGNKAAYGGALFLRGESGGVSNPDISASTFTGNYAGIGGAIYNYGFGGTASPRITNSTFSKNKSGNGAAIVSDGRNTGGISKPIISNSTFFGNAGGNGVIYNIALSGGMTEAKFDNVILWNPGSAEIANYNAGSSTIIDNSVIEGGCPTTQATCQDVSAADPLLGPLQDNGGATWTHLPGPNGSAIDAANPALCGDAPFDVDQRGVARPQGPACDIGSIELRQAQFGVSVSGPGSISANASSPSASGGIINCEEEEGSCVAGYAIEPGAATIVLDLTPASNAHLDSIIDTCGSGGVAIGVVAGSKYTLTPVTSDCIAIATFALDTHSIAGTVSGLAGSGLGLQLNAGENLPIAANGSFEFSSVLESGSNYAVSVSTQPGQPTQTCTVANGSGVINASDITNVEVTCTTNSYTVGGQVSGLLGSGLSLQLGTENLPINADGSFTFATPLASGSAYEVVVATPPSQPRQLCTIANASGMVTAGNITNVAVTCNLPTPHLVLGVDNNRHYLRYGRFVDYIVTLQNDGDATASGVAVSSVLSSAFDGAFAQWQCFGAGAGAQCTAAGSGPLADTASLPPGRTLTWRVSVPVRTDAADDDATFTVSIDGAAPASASDTDLLVLLRDGFDEPYGSGDSIPELESQAIINGEVVREINVQQPSVDLVDTLMTLHAKGDEILVQRTSEDAHHSWIRLMQRDTKGNEKITAWSRVLHDAHLVIGGLTDLQGTEWILLDGTENPLRLPTQRSR